MDLYDKIRERILQLNMEVVGETKEEEKYTAEQREIIKCLSDIHMRMSYRERTAFCRLVTLLRNDGVDYKTAIEELENEEVTNERTDKSLGQMIEVTRGNKKIVGVLYKKLSSTYPIYLTGRGSIANSTYWNEMEEVPRDRIEEELNKFITQLRYLPIYEKKVPKSFLDALGIAEE